MNSPGPNGIEGRLSEPTGLLVESISEGALILAADDSIYYCNQCMGEMLGLPINKIIGSNLFLHIEDGRREELIELIRAAREEGKAGGEFSIRRADGATLPVKVSLNIMTIENLSALGAIVTDLTSQKTAELELREFAEKLRRSNEELEDFAFVASHDLQEPLRKIQTFGDMLKKQSGEALNEIGRDYLSRMQNAAGRMRKLLADLLALSRVSRVQEPFKVLNVRELVEDVVEDLAGAIMKTGGEVKISDLPVIKAVPSQMRRLFQNLISNALKYRSDRPPRIKVYAAPADPGYCRICVEDNGMGFDEKCTEQIFKPFQRLHGRSEFEGAGMGLAICRKIVELHGGAIWAKSKPGEGATFFVTLPVKRA
jgi:PAS domain S-box-containing protein